MIEDGLRPQAYADPVRADRCRGSDPGVLGAHRVGVGHVGHQGVGRDGPQPAGLEVLERLPDFVLGVHHEGAVVLDGLPDGLAPEDQRLEVVGPAGVLRVVGPQRDEVARRRT